MNIKKKILKRINKAIIYKKTYKIGNSKIIIPSSSNLPNNQKKHSLYDRFLPVLAKHLKNDGIIIDVGANVGDTLISMIHNCQNPFVCVEPSTFFFNYLKENVENLDLHDRERVQLIHELIGTGDIYGEIKNVGGSTATIQVSESQIGPTHIALDAILSDKSDNIALLKSDVDGYDYDVIKSAKEILKNSEPILFWENEIHEEHQYNGYNSMCKLIAEKGYKYIYIFDNYGNLLLENADVNALICLNDYLYDIEKNKHTRTFYYVDVLASTEKNQIIIKNAIDDYKKNYLKRT